MKSRIIILSVICALVVSGCSLIKPPSPSNQNNQAVVSIPPGKFYFSSATCSHCATVNEYVVEHRIKERLYYVEVTIDNNQENVRLLESIGQRCGLSPSNLSVPFFWDGQKCYQGSDEVIGYFETSN